jgi:hypothetical protein
VLSIAEIREQLGDAITGRKKIEVLLSTWPTGTPAQVTAVINKAAKDAGIVGETSVLYRQSSSRYVYNARSYRDRYVTTPAGWVITGYRPYTDEELEADGPKLITAKRVADARAAKTRAANVKKFNALAAKLGQPSIEA